MFGRNFKINKRIVTIWLLEYKILNKYNNQSILLESFYFHNISDEELYKMCDNSIEMANHLKRFFNRKFLGLIFEVAGKTGLAYSTYTTILCWITDIDVKESLVSVVLSYLLNTIGVILQGKDIDEVALARNIQKIYNFIVFNTPIDDLDDK